MHTDYLETKRDARFEMKEEGSSYALYQQSRTYDRYRYTKYRGMARFAVEQYLALGEAVGAWG